MLIFAASSFAKDHDHFDYESLLNDDNLLIVDIHLGRYKLAENVFIYTSPEATLIPLQPLFDSIDFPIEVDPVALKAYGWFIEENIFRHDSAPRRKLMNARQNEH